MQTFERPLLDSERRWLRLATGPARAAGRGMARAIFVVVALISGLLAVLTLAVSRVDWRVVATFWALFGVFVGLWTYLGERRRVTRVLRVFDGALARNMARVIPIQSSAVVEIEEQDDEGATYAFQFAEAEIVFVRGGEFHRSARFPNSDFDIVELLGHTDFVVGTLLRKRGDKLAPVRKISPTSAKALGRPRHLQVIKGSLNDLEQLLTNPSSFGS